MTETVFEQFYRGDGRPPWDLDGPTPFVATLEAAGLFGEDVLDAGCGTGENALYLAARGHHVVGVDAAPTAIERARGKAAGRGIDVTFTEGDACELAGFVDRFDTVLDCGLFHVLTADEQSRYVASLGRATRPHALVHLWCFAHDGTPAGERPAGCRCHTHGVSEAELNRAFGEGWSIEALESGATTIAAPGHEREARFWLVRIRRR